jgi:sugar phosphate isomerase/epimerase
MRVWTSRKRTFSTTSDRGTRRRTSPPSARYGLDVTHNGYLSDYQLIDGPPVVCTFTREETDDPNDLRRATDAFFSHCGALKCENALVLSSIERSGTVERAAEDLWKLADWAARYKIRLAYEFMGLAKQLRDLPSAWETVKKVDRENVGLCIDTFHVNRGKSRIDSIRQVPKEKVFLVHLNDAKQRPVEQLGDYDRVCTQGRGSSP